MKSAAARLPGWLARRVATLGGAGLFLVAFLDSSVLSFPFITDLLVLELSTHNRARMIYYAGMATLGSVAGCIWLYLLAKKGGEAYYRRREGQPVGKIRRWVQRHGFLSAVIPALLPPPIPFKAFVLAEGIFQVPLEIFVWGILLGRAIRYFAEGILAVHYGPGAERYLMHNKLVFSAIVLGFILLGYCTSQWLFRRAQE